MGAVASLRIVLVLTLIALVGACTPLRGVTRLQGPTMGTTWSVQVVSSTRVDETAIVVAVNRELDAVVAQMSTWQPDSDISRFNRSAAGTTQWLPPAFATVLDAALDLAAATDGAFDPTVGTLVDLWGFGAGRRRGDVPTDAEIEQARRQVGWSRLVFDRARSRVLQPGGVQLDLSSIAEGYAVDRIGAALERLGITDYLAEIGGELRARGRRKDGRGWQVALESPDASALSPVVVALRDRSIATSGDYRKFFVVDGERYSHTIDPTTGRPVAHALAAVTVVADDVMTAGSTATALNVLGPQRGLAYAEAHGIAAHFVERRPSGFTTFESRAFARERGAAE